MSNFHVGQRVVCVDAHSVICDGYGRFGWDFTYIPLEQGRIYVVRNVGLSQRDKVPVVWLREVIRPTQAGEYEEGYSASRFRPLIETDISIFQAILANPHKELEAVE